MSDIALQAAPKVLVQGRSSRQDNVLVEASPDVDGGRLDDTVDNSREGGQEVGGVDFGVEEDFRGEESLVSDIDVDAAAIGRGHGVFQEPVRLAVVASELLNNIRAYVTMFFLYFLCSLETAVWLAAVAEKVLYEIRDVSTSDGYALDGGADDVALSDGDNVGHTIAGVDNGAGQGSIGDLGGCPGCGKGKDCLDGNVETGAVERLEHDLGRVLAVLGRIQGLR